MLAIINSGVANADMAAVAYVDYAGTGNKESGGPVVDNMDVMLNENIYEILPQTSRVKFRVDSPIGDVWASFQEFEGRFAILKNSENDNLASIEINADSLDTDGGFIGMLLKSKRFFDVENFPNMHFVGSSLEWYKDTHAVLKGYLTIKNMTRKVAFYIELVDADIDGRNSERITVKAATTIKRSLFGIYSMLPAVSDDVNLFMSIDAVKKNSSLSMR